jgi:hypothetical protein
MPLLSAANVDVLSVEAALWPLGKDAGGRSGMAWSGG